MENKIKNPEFKTTIQDIKNNLNLINFDKVEVEDKIREKDTENLLTTEQIIQCLKYVPNNEPNNLERLNFLESMEKLLYIKSKYLGQNPKEWSNTEIKYVDTYLITFKNKHGKKFSIKFYNSLMDTLEGKTINLHDILTTIALEGTLDTSSFKAYCSELGGDIDSIKELRNYKALVNQQKKIFKVFSKSELYDFPQ